MVGTVAGNLIESAVPTTKVFGGRVTRDGRLRVISVES